MAKGRQFMLISPVDLDFRRPRSILRGVTTRLEPISPFEPLRARPDPLAESLHFLRMSGSFYALTELSAPWGIYLPPMEGLEGCVWFHVPTTGPCRVELQGEDPLVLGPGDLALVPHGRGHTLRGEEGAEAPNILDLERTLIGDRYELLRHGGGGEPTRLICGAVRFDHPAAQRLTELLPAALMLPARDAAADGWIQSTLRLMDAEAAEPKPGGEAVITRLSDILVIQAIRHWLESDPAARQGWLGAIQDPAIGKALSLIHREPGWDWTLDSLSREVAMSRSAFAERFTRLVGEGAGQYLTRWRMSLALEALERDGATVAELADRYGYRSEAAFSRAFKRVTGRSPGAVRRGLSEGAPIAG
jgi:AraC-like DNA-binding protein